MTTNNNEATNENKVHLLDELQTLLVKQLELARQDNIGEVEALSKQASSLVEKITQTGIPGSPETVLTAEQKQQLGKLYENLCLAISAQKTGLCADLKQIRKGKKTIKAYRSHI